MQNPPPYGQPTNSDPRSKPELRFAGGPAGIGQPSPRGETPLRRRLPPRVASVTDSPSWAGEHGEELVRRSKRKAQASAPDPFEHVDPLQVFSDWFGPGDPNLKPVFDPSFEGWHPRRIRVGSPSTGRRRLDIDPAPGVQDVVTVSYSFDGRHVETERFSDFHQDMLWSALPMRSFARRLEQENKPVSTWLHTNGHHVGCESHHERTMMTVADFHSAIHRIAGQPFTLTWPKDSPAVSHTPDSALLSSGRIPLVLDVKTPEDAVSEDWVAKRPHVEAAVHAMGMGYLVWTGISRRYRRNLELLTEARVPEESYALWSAAALALCDGALPVRVLAERLEASGYRLEWALMLIRRMLWRRVLLTDMFRPFDSMSVVWRADAAV